MQYLERTITTLDWATLIFVGCFVLLAIAKSMYPKRFNDFIKLPFSNNYFIKNRGEVETKHPFTVILLVIQVFSIALFLYLFFKDNTSFNLGLFTQIIIGVVIFIFVKIGVEKIVATIFSFETLIDQYIYKKITFRNYIALILMIISLFFYYSYPPKDQMLLLFLGLTAIFNIIFILYSYKNYRSILIGNFFYFLLYICTLEISPYFILYKAIKMAE